MRSFFTVIDRLLALLVCVPPLYIVYRFIKWYLRQGAETEET